MLNFLLLLKTFYRSLHQCDGFDVSMVLEVEKSPELSLNQFSLQFFVHGMDLLIAEDESVVAGNCFLGGVGVIREEDELFQQLHAPSLPLELQIGQQGG